MSEVNYTFTVDVPRQLRDRQMESVDHAVDILRSIDGVTVTGWCDEEFSEEPWDG